ncbi:MAG: glycosyltransferase [Candidatus Omnitrophica bacterium]|jgi:cellulose synthase/poly-beta-1,6-N-acetylglucosamine synthase-like glycosyltransferase|nr:glycosyltransferase [Candidatus Omnitrophota bacterium]
MGKFSSLIFIFFFSYFFFLSIFYLFLAFLGFVEGRKRSWESQEEDYPLAYLSSNAISVSIIIPARNEEDWITDSLFSVLNLNYPKFEVIIVNDDSKDKTFENMDKILQLKPLDMPYVKHYQDGIIQRIFKSAKYPNVMVINKNKGLKKAGAVNAGLNFAKNEYVCVVDADTVLEQDAMLKVMAHIGRDPDRIIGIGSYFGLANDLLIKEGRILKKRFSFNPLIAYQNLEYVRSFIGNRLGWSKYNAMPIVSGGFSMWRRDILYELGGFSADFTCEDIEFTFRAHDYLVKNKDKRYRIVMLPYSVGWTEGPSNIKSLISQRSRWQRVTDETIAHYKYMIFNPRFGAFAFLTLPYFFLYEVLGVFFETASIILMGLGWLQGFFDWQVFLLFVIFMALTQAITTIISLFSFLRIQRLFPAYYVVYLIILSLFESFWYRWIIAAAKLLGTYTFLAGVKDQNQYQRASRQST